MTDYRFLTSTQFLKEAFNNFDTEEWLNDQISEICERAAQAWSGIIESQPKISAAEAALAISTLEHIKFECDPDNKQSAINALMYMAMSLERIDLNMAVHMDKLEEENQTSDDNVVQWEKAKADFKKQNNGGL